MKRITAFLAIILLSVTSVMAQHRETFDLQNFDRIKLDGNIRLYLTQDTDTQVKIETRKESYVNDYRVEVRNNILYIQYRDNGFGSTPKLKVYIKHPELKGIDMDGFVHLNSKNVIKGESLAIKGDGFVRGTVEVDVTELKVDLDGFCFMSFEGKAEKSDLSLDGAGRINAQHLEVSKISKSVDGLAGIRLQ